MSTNKSENAEIAVLQTQMEDVKTSLSSVEGKVDKLLDRFETTSNSFVTKAEIDRLIIQFNKDIKSAKNFNWLTHSLTAILTAFVVAIAYWIISGVHQ